MSQGADKEIIRWIKEKKYSKLNFLDKCYLSSDNTLYLGFYYFIQDSKNKNTEHVLNAIVERENSESSAYYYLANIAYKIFNSFNERHISACYYRKSIELDKDNSDAYLGLYKTNGRVFKTAFEALKVAFTNGDFDKLELYCEEISYPYDVTNILYEDWLLLKEMFLKLPNLNNSNLLILVHFHLKEFDSGLTIIRASDRVEARIIKLYLDSNLISVNEALSKKISYHHLNTLLGEKHTSIYQEVTNEFKKNNINLSTFIRAAFQAEEYEDVVSYYDNVSSEDISFLLDLSARQYYLLALLFLNKDINIDLLNDISLKLIFLADESLALMQAIQFKLKLRKLNKLFLENESLEHEIKRMSDYCDAERLLDKPELSQSFLHQKLYDELKSLEDEWNKAYYKHKFTTLKNQSLNNDVSTEDFRILCNLGIICKQYDFVMENINTFHKSNEATMSSYNCLAICYENKGNIGTAVEQYKKALNLMYASEESDHVIISNYVSCAKKLSNEQITSGEFDKLKVEYNESIINQFKWYAHLTKSGTSLFKYLPFNINSIDSLTNHYFYLADKNQLNDPIEFPNLSSIEKDSLIDSNYRICSFSNNENSMLMWSHYAHEHQGVLIEYWFGGELPDGIGIGKVNYSNEVKRNKEKDTYTFNQYILTKNQEWSYENEVRLFSNTTSKVYFENYDYLDYDRSKVNAQIRSITLGYKFPEDKKQLIKNIIKTMNKNRKDYEPKILIKEAYMPDGDNFSLKYRDIGGLKYL